MIAQLIEDHGRIRAIADDLEVYLCEAVPPIDPGFGRSRWALIRELTTHLALERQVMARCCGPEQLSRSSAGDAILDAMLEDHVLAWSFARLQEDWDEYRCAARELLRKLRVRMAYEDRLIFPKLALPVAKS